MSIAPFLTVVFTSLAFASSSLAAPEDADANWAQFRGPAASGVGRAAGPVKWDVSTVENVLWRVAVPGLGHSSPVVWGDRVFLTAAVPVEAKDQPLKTGLYGDIAPVREDAEYRWLVLCFDKASGRLLWEREARRGVPKVKRHPKSSHANPTPAADARRVVAFFGSEGLYCYDHDGRPLWQRDFGLLDSGFFLVPDAQWGFASSPVLSDGTCLVLADVQKGSFLAALDASDGSERWRTPRQDVPTWGTPTLHRGGDARPAQVIVNGYKEIAGYDLSDGRRRWWMGGGGDIPVPTPIVAHGLIFVTSAHGPQAPIFAIRTTAEGDVSLPRGQDAGAHVAWSVRRGGNYMQTPIVVGDLLFCCRDNGLLTCFDAASGRELYRQRLDGTGFIASPVAAGDRLYFASEDGRAYVVRAGPKFELLAENELGGPCLATPAVSGGTVFFRTQGHLLAVGEK
jgi:outer membrane protein assembly factor BamB